MSIWRMMSGDDGINELAGLVINESFHFWYNFWVRLMLIHRIYNIE